MLSCNDKLVYFLFLGIEMTTSNGERDFVLALFMFCKISNFVLVIFMFPMTGDGAGMVYNVTSSLFAFRRQYIKFYSI